MDNDVKIIFVCAIGSLIVAKIFMMIAERQQNKYNTDSSTTNKADYEEHQPKNDAERQDSTEDY